MQKGQIKRKLIANGIAGSYGLFVTLLSQVVTAPFYISSWGGERFGEWLVVQSIPAYLVFADIGFGNSAANQLVMLKADGDFASAKKVFHTLCAVQLAIGIVIGTFIPLSTRLFEWGRILGLRNMQPPEVARLIVLFGVYISINMQAQAYAALYRYSGRYARYAALSNSSRLVELFVTIVCLCYDYNETTVALGMCASRLFALVIYHFDTRTQQTELPLGVAKVSSEWLRHLAMPGFGLFVTGLAQTMQAQGIAVVLNRHFGAESVLSFTIGRTLLRVPSQLIVLVNGAVAPEVSAMARLPFSDSLKQLHRLMMQSSLALSILSMVVTVTLGPWLVDHWLQGKVSIGHTLLVAINLGVIINLFWYSSSVLLNATNQNVRFGLIYFSSSLVVFLVLLCSPNASFTLTLIAPSITELIVASYVIPKACLIARDNVCEAVKSSLRFQELVALLCVRLRGKCFQVN